MNMISPEYQSYANEARVLLLHLEVRLFRH